MFFPFNIDNQIKMSKKASSKDKASIITFAVIGGGVFLYLGISPFFTEVLHLPSIVAFLLCMILSISVLVFILRTFVFREKELLNEEENSKNDSLERFYHIVESELPNMIDGIEVFENDDGNMCACLEVLYGPNDRLKSEKTKDFLVELFNTISKFCIDFKVFVTKEDFSRSIECKRFLNTVNSVKDKRLAPVISEMADLVLGFTSQKSNLYSTYIVIRFTPVNSRMLPGLQSQLLDVLHSSRSSIRNLEFSDRQRFRAFIRDYYRVEALDLSTFRGGKLTSKLLRKYRKHIFLVDKVDVGYNFNTGVKKV